MKLPTVKEFPMHVYLGHHNYDVVILQNVFAMQSRIQYLLLELKMATLKICM